MPACFYSILRLKQSLAGGQSTEPVSATSLAPVSRQGFAPQILAEQFTHFIRELLYPSASSHPSDEAGCGLK
jgi:hypothetical protein